MKKRLPRSKETKKKISKTLTGIKRLPFTKEHKEKIRIANLGKIISAKTKEKMSNTHKAENNPNWLGGITNNPYPEDWKESFRESIRQRDDYICQVCGIHQDEFDGWNKKLDIHHKDYNKNNLNPENLISLCRSCHIKTNHNREYWISYFKGRTK